jgi:hypothetical protein
MREMSSSAQAALLLSPEERVRYLQISRWISYDYAETILKDLQELLEHPRVLRMPNFLLWGDTNCGKTAIIDRFCQQYPPRLNSQEEADNVPVVYIQAPPMPDERRFCALILNKLGVPHKTNERADVMMCQILRMFPKLGMRMLIIDEIHHILAGNLQKQRTFLNVIKFLGNEALIPIVGVGTVSALNALRTDAQLANRFEPRNLPRWRLDTRYRRLLASFEYVLPLAEESNLAEKEMATKLLDMSGGTIGELSKLIRRAAIEAIRRGEEKIVPSLLKEVPWIPPDVRNRPAA